MDAEHLQALADWHTLVVVIPISLIIFFGIMHSCNKMVEKNRHKCRRRNGVH